jgi:hypothetical protein
MLLERLDHLVYEAGYGGHQTIGERDSVAAVLVG